MRIADSFIACSHCEEILELCPYSYRNPERLLQAKQLFTTEHLGCEQYAGRPSEAQRHRKFVRRMRSQMRLIAKPSVLALPETLSPLPPFPSCTTGVKS